MAIAGAGGWLPSCQYIYRNGRLQSLGTTSNKPQTIVYTDMEQAATALLSGLRIQVHMKAGNVAHLERLVGVAK